MTDDVTRDRAVRKPLSSRGWSTCVGFVVALLLLVVSACRPVAGDDSLMGPSDSCSEPCLAVVATTSVLADFASEIGGDRVQVASVVPVGGDPHKFEPRPSDAALIAQAELVLDNGLGLSPWFHALASNVTGQLVTLTDEVQAQALDSSGTPDPHMWMAPPLVLEGYLPAIERALAELDPAGASYYARRAAKYRERLTALDNELRKEMATIPESNRILVTTHDAYSYFARHYGLGEPVTLVGVSTEQEPSAQTVAAMVARIRSARVPTVFVETTVNPAVLEQAAKEGGAQVGRPIYGDSLGTPGSGADTYEEMMRANVAALVAGLAGTR